MEFKIKHVNRFTKFLWKAAGADEELLQQGTYKERVTYFCLGGIVLSTGILATLTGGYAFSYVFSTESYLAKLALVLFALFWGYIIFNLDRFIVAAGGKGDGTEKMTAGEWGRSTPRIIMAIVIGLTLSAPLELKIFEKEINAEIVKRKGEAVKDYNQNILKVNYDDKIAVQDSIINALRSGNRPAVDRLEKKISEKESDIRKQRDEYTEEARDRAIGPIARAMKKELNKLERELTSLKQEKVELKSSLGSDIQPMIAKCEKKIATLEKDKAHDIKEFKGTLGSFDGIAARLNAAHHSEDISETYIWFIKLLLLVIELTPIIFKMQLTKGAYDYMQEYQKYLILAKNGIQLDVALDSHADDKKDAKDVPTFHTVEVKKYAMSKETELKKASIEKEAQKIKKEL